MARCCKPQVSLGVAGYRVSYESREEIYPGIGLTPPLAHVRDQLHRLIPIYRLPLYR